MRVLVGFCLLTCAATTALAARPKSILLQHIDIWEKSTEGGEGKLYRATQAALAPCRIDVLLYGEMGKTGWTFMFGPRLLTATRTDYHYNRPFYMKAGGRVTSTVSVTLRTAEERKQLQADFLEFKALFDPRKLTECEKN